MSNKITYILLILCLGLSSSVFAKSPKHKKAPVEEPELSRELDLSIPTDLEDEMGLDDDSNPNHPFKHKSKTENPTLLNSKNKKRAVDLDCGMAVNPYAQSDSSIGNRLTGECDFKYRY
ncbi:MAG: hypothetical protein EBR59_09155 [Methylococcaceae bacterium]|jgi:hypothetical protein|nr:hypothetical protein [Methylococcaceae bacterium]